jgi:hypothetical protein
VKLLGLRQNSSFWSRGLDLLHAYATPDHLPSIEALASSWDRFKRLGRMGMTGAEYNAVAAALVLTDDMQKLCTRRELDSAMTTVFQQAAIFEPRPKGIA